MGTETIEFAVRSYVGIVLGIALFIFTLCLGLGITDYLNSGRPIFEIVATVFSPNWPIWGFFSFLIASYGLFLLQAVYQISTTPPIRFNRQRREVAYVAKRGQPPRFIPWEEVIACVSSSIVPTEYGSQQKFALMIGLVDASDGQVTWLTVPAFTLGMAVSEWEAIRVYMEEGPDALPKSMMGDPEQGTVELFHMCRRDYLLDHGYLRYFFGFLLIQFCSGWTLPCHIATWVQRLPKTAFPKSVQNWSKPLPRDQWQSPSAELIAQSKEVRKSFRKGMDIFEHFREKENNPSKTRG
ncbi:DUF6708 domain-containing protein [Pseudomonas syringae]|uniref:DUF6708 domain-containing protein n=1 Tax=Pseudomonas syringae TaxID=317 RepID=UPI001EFAF84F|nr:DUF6708 domain-containing protein [Pseudomonas syringae]